jgi:hypothetical protein
MNTCPTELLKGYKVDNLGTASIEVPIDQDDNYNVITVFNESDQDVLVEYKTVGNYSGSFYVPKNGRSFTRIMYGVLVNNSLKVRALFASNGSVFFNLGN